MIMPSRSLAALRHQGRLAVLLLAALLPSAALGQSSEDEQPGEPEARDLGLVEEIDVVGDQVERTQTVTVVERREIVERHSPVAFDALDKKPGLHLRSRLGMTGAGLTRLAIRGNGAAGPAGLAVFTDGRPDASVSFAHPTPSAMSLFGVERIEVIHGPSPVLHGSGNTGVVNLTTARPGAGFRGALQVSAGAHDTSENFLRLSHGGERSYFRVDSTYRTTDGDNPSSDARIFGAWLRAGFRLSESWDLVVGAGQNDDHFTVNGPFFVPGPFGNPGTTELDLKQTVADVVLRGSTGNWRTSFQLFYDDLDPESQVLRPGVRRAQVSESGARFKAVTSASWAERIVIGVDYLDAQARNKPGVPPPAPEQDESLDELGPYVYLESGLSERVKIAGGVRVVDHSAYGSEPVAELGFVFGLGDASERERSSLRVRATHGYQSPTLQQLFGVFRGGRGGLANPDLEPEVVDQYEIGYHRRGGRYSIDVVAFLQEGEDLIQVTSGQLQNFGEFSHPGFELTAGFDLNDQVALGLGITALDLEDGVLGIPDQTVDLSLLYRPEGWASRDASLSVIGRYSDAVLDQITGQAPVRELESYFVADLMLRAKVAGDLYGFLQIDNFTDEDYETVSTIPMPGITPIVGLAIGFGD